MESDTQVKTKMHNHFRLHSDIFVRKARNNWTANLKNSGKATTRENTKQEV